jgi:hypothetical protein
MQPIICELKFFSDCTSAREHPENEKFSLLQIRPTHSSNVAAPFSSLRALLQAVPKRFRDAAIGPLIRDERSHAFHRSTAPTYRDLNGFRTVCGAATFR